MSQQFENSLDAQGNIERFSPEFCFTPAPALAVHSPKKKPKKKRGRPRKALPLNFLASDFLCRTNPCQNNSYQNDWASGQSVAEKNNAGNSAADLKIPAVPHLKPSPKKTIPEKNHLHAGYFDSDNIGKELPFSDEELTTLDKFEKLSRSVEQHSNSPYDIKRIDQPAITPSPVVLPKQKKNVRRRQIDPSTCERDYSPDEVEFMNALNEYKRTSGRMFPTCSEILEVLKSLGYEKQNSQTDNWNEDIPSLVNSL